MERTQKWTVVLDLDGSLETPYFRKDDSANVREWMLNHPFGYAFERLYSEIMDGLPHFILNGTLELLRWVHDKGFEIVFFSNAVEERNRELCPILMERAFGKGNEPPYRVLSRGDCIDTRRMDDEEGKVFQGLWFGNYKKKLAGVVVAEVPVSAVTPHSASPLSLPITIYSFLLSTTFPVGRK